MLKIKTSNGDTLIHDDQESDAMKFTATDGSQVVVHAGAWGRHKYIRKEGNRYIYPEDLEKAKNTASNIGNNLVNTARMIGNKAQSVYNTAAPVAVRTTKTIGNEAKKIGQDTASVAKDAYNNAKTTASNIVADQKQKDKDREFKKDEKNHGQAPGVKRNDQILSAHNGALEKHIGIGSTAIRPGASGISTLELDDRRRNNKIRQLNKSLQRSSEIESDKSKEEFERKRPDSSVKTPSKSKSIADTARRKEEKTHKESERQSQSGIEAGRKREKARTAEKETRSGIEAGRKRARNLDGDRYNRFEKNKVIDDDKEVRKARKKWLGKEDNDYTDEDGMTVTKNSAAGKSRKAAVLKDSVNRTPHEGAKIKASREERAALDKAGEARREYLKARRTAVGIEAGRARRRIKNNK